MPDEGHDGILKLLEKSRSEEELLLDLDDPRRKHELITALEGDGRMYMLENDLAFNELDSLTVGIGRKLREYLYREPPEKRPKKVRL